MFLRRLYPQVVGRAKEKLPANSPSGKKTAATTWAMLLFYVLSTSASAAQMSKAESHIAQQALDGVNLVEVFGPNWDKICLSGEQISPLIKSRRTIIGIGNNECENYIDGIWSKRWQAIVLINKNRCTIIKIPVEKFELAGQDGFECYNYLYIKEILIHDIIISGNYGASIRKILQIK